MVTIEEFLNRKNPDIDNSNTSPGPNTVSTKYSNVSKVDDWEEFNYKTLKSLYGEILDQPIPILPQHQTPTELETEIWDERQLEFVISQYILGPVRFALGLAYRYCEESWKHNLNGEFHSPIDPGAGGRAKRPKESDDPRFRPDWSCVRKNHMTTTKSRSYFNYCPGDTKLAKKWKYEWHRTEFEAWKTPPEQVQTYAGDHWNVRHTWIITEEGVTVFLITKEDINPGLATSRESRVHVAPTTPGHGRVASGDTDLSSLMAPLSITTHSYQEDYPNVEYQPIKAKFIPWNGIGKGLNVKKALFLLFMLAGAPCGPKLVQSNYPPLDSWCGENEMFRHNSTGRVKRRLQPNDVLCDPFGQSTVTTSPTRGPGQMETATREQSQLTRSMVEGMKWNDEHEVYYYWDSGNKVHWITNGVIVLDQESGRYGVFEGRKWTEVGSEQPDKGRKEKRRKVEGQKGASKHRS